MRGLDPLLYDRLLVPTRQIQGAEVDVRFVGPRRRSRRAIIVPGEPAGLDLGGMRASRLKVPHRDGYDEVGHFLPLSGERGVSSFSNLAPRWRLALGSRMAFLVTASSVKLAHLMIPRSSLVTVFHSFLLVKVLTVTRNYGAPF
jgi:hypothetical protein